jgi:hypothetical protein
MDSDFFAIASSFEWLNLDRKISYSKLRKMSRYGEVNSLSQHAMRMY